MSQSMHDHELKFTWQELQCLIFSTKAALEWFDYREQLSSEKGNLPSPENTKVIDSWDELEMQDVKALLKRFVRVQEFHGIHHYRQKYIDRIHDLDKLIVQSNDPLLVLERGECHFFLREYASAERDFSKALESFKVNPYVQSKSEWHSWDAQRKFLLFWRVETFLKLGKKAEALSDINVLGTGIRFLRFLTYDKRDIDDLVADYEKLPS
jgi:tetratricopeptide (TPR) repeat protein